MEQPIGANTEQNFVVQPGVPTVESAPLVPATKVGVKVISVLYYLSAVVFIFSGLMLLFLGSISFNFLSSLGLSLGIVPGILISIWGALSFLVGRGLWSGKQWGRILAIIVSGLYLISGIISLINQRGDALGYVSLAVNLGVILLLVLSRSSFQPDSSKVKAIVLPVLAIVVFAGMKYPSIIKPKTSNFEETINFLQSRSIKQKDTSPDTNTSTDSNLRGSTEDSVASTGTTGQNQTTGFLYENTEYNFQMKLPAEYTTNSFDGTDFDVVLFRDLQKIPILGVRVDNSEKRSLNEYVDYRYSMQKTSVEKLVDKVAGEKAFHTIVTIEGKVMAEEYFFYHKGLLYILTKEQAANSDQFSTVAKSFAFTK